MPKEAFGGGDEGGGAPPEKRKLVLDRYGLPPDVNIRDVFWKLISAYAASKHPDAELARLQHDRFALMRVAVSVLSSRDSEKQGLEEQEIASYSMMMMIDGGWKDALSEFLQSSCDRRLGINEYVSGALRSLLQEERYKKTIIEHLSTMVRGRSTSDSALEYIASIGSADLANALKTELMIIARGDIGANQLNAINAIALINDDEEVKKSFIVLLSHWDSSARLAAAKALSSMADARDVKAAALKRLASETDEEIISVLKRIAG